MKFGKIQRVLALVGLGLLTTPSAWATDAVALEIGGGESVKFARVGLQWDWDRQFWKSNGTHIGGYWDLTLAQWRGDRHRNIEGRRQDITVLGITPVFRFQGDDRKGLYVEAGIGAHLFSETYDNNGKQLSTRFQFGDHLGLGYVFGNDLDVGLKVQHFSNGGIKKPNDGADFIVLTIRHRF